MNRVIIGQKNYFSNLEWRVDQERKFVAQSVKSLKTDFAMDFVFQVKTKLQKTVITSTAGVDDKEMKNEMKMEPSAGALFLSLYNKISKKPETIGTENHMIAKTPSSDNEVFNPQVDKLAKNWIGVFSAEDINEKRNGFWVSIIIQSAPTIAFFDKFYAAEDIYEIQDSIIELINDLDLVKRENERNDEFLFLSDSTEILERFKFMADSSKILQHQKFESINAPFDRLVDGIKMPSIEKAYASSFKPVYALVALAIGGAAIGANYYISYLDEVQEQERMMRSQKSSEKTQEENLKMQKEYEELKIKTLNETLEEAKKELNEAISVGDPVLTIQGWLDLVYKIRLDHAGWDLKSLDCKIVKERASCNVSLQRGKLATNKNLLLSYPQAKISGEKATYGLRSQDLINYEKKDYQSLPNTESFIMDTMSSLQQLDLAGVKYSTTADQEITKTVVLPEPPSKIIRQEMNVDPIKMGVSTGKLKIQGKGGFLLEGLKNWINDPTLKVDKIKISIDQGGSMSWDLEGNYFIKIADKPTLPEIPPSKLGVAGPRGFE